jgi:GNAT superfamily N-acetyltransferase
LIRLERKYIKPASLMLACAFIDLFSEIVPNQEERKRQNLYIWEYLLRRDYSYTTTMITSPKLEGLAVWMHSDKHVNNSVWWALLSGAIWPAFRINKKIKENITVWREYADKKRYQFAPFKHWYLKCLAVDPKYQGMRFASHLLDGMFQKSDRDGLPYYVETEGEKNISIYKHFGFKVVGEFQSHDTKGTNIAMLRRPK